MSNSGFETSQPQSQLTVSAPPRGLVFSALGRHGVRRIRLAWGAFAATHGDMGTAAHSFRGSSPRSLPWTMWPGLPRESKQEGRMCQRGKAAVGERFRCWKKASVGASCCPQKLRLCHGLLRLDLLFAQRLLFWEGICRELAGLQPRGFLWWTDEQVLEKPVSEMSHTRGFMLLLSLGL